MTLKFNRFSRTARDEFFSYLEKSEYVNISLSLIPNPNGDKLDQYPISLILMSEEICQIYEKYSEGNQPYQSFRKLKKTSLEKLAELLGKKVRIIKDDSGTYNIDKEFEPKKAKETIEI